MASDGDAGSSDPEVTTDEEFAEAVAAVVRSAVANGVDVRGSWMVEAGTDGGYDVEVVAVAPRHRADGSPATAVVEAVADHEGVAPTDLPPLADAVDPESLDAVVDDGRLSFEYCGYDVTVHADGSVSLGE
jgi:hypothetical protein